MHESIFSDGMEFTKARVSTHWWRNSPRKCMRTETIQERGDGRQAQLLQSQWFTLSTSLY